MSRRASPAIHVLPASRGDGPLNGFNKRKAAFDRACGVGDWTLHDLRRTSRSLMSRAGVRPDISERVLGHAIAGVEGVYDRHHYDQEKADALAKLARLIERIVKPTGNVIELTDCAQAQLRGCQNKYSCASMACEPSDVLGTTRSGWFGRGRDLLEDGWQRDAEGAA